MPRVPTALSLAPDVRLAAPTDADAIGALMCVALADKFRPALGRAAVRAMAAVVADDLERRVGRYWVAADGDELLGAVHLIFGGERSSRFLRVVAGAAGPVTAVRAYLVMSALGTGVIARDEAYVEELVVAESARGRGIGRRLLQACVQDAHDAGRRRLGLHVTLDNEPALGLYRSMGLMTVGECAWRLRRRLFRAPGLAHMQRPI